MGPEKLLTSLTAATFAIPLFFASSDAGAEEAEPESAPKPEPKLVFASAAEAKALLSKEDAFTKRLSPFDLQARMGEAETPKLPVFLRHVGDSAIEWADSEKRHLSESWGNVLKRLKVLKVELPGSVTVIRTNGEEEPGAAYTRGTSIIFHPGSVKRGMDGLLAHELFHIISRGDPKLRDELYKIIGFEHCGEIAFPKTLQSRKMTNPDAPVNQHAIELLIAGAKRWALPILLAKNEFDAEKKEGFMSYFTLQFMAVEKSGDRWVVAEKPKGTPRIASIMRVKGFHEQIGKNTGYIIHPEEILAENFRHLVTGKKGSPNPEIVEKMRAVFADWQG